MAKYKKKYIRTATNVRQCLAESVNALRNAETIDKLEIERHRAIAYICQIALSAIRDGDIEDRLKAIENRINE